MDFRSVGETTASVPVISNSVMKRDPHHTSDKRYNIVLFGVEECSVGTSRHGQMELDIDNTAPFLCKTRPFSRGKVRGSHPPEGEVEFDSI